MGESLKDRLESTRGAKRERTTDEFAGVLSKMLGGSTRFEIARTVWPGTDIPIGLRLLSEWEVQQADARARAWATEKKLGTGDDRMREREYIARYACEVLAVALVDTRNEPPTPLVSSADELAKTATREELGRLSTEMSDHQQALAPFPEQLTDDELDKLATALKKAPRTAATVLNTCAPSTLRRLCLSLASPPRKPTGSSSSQSKEHGGDEPTS